MSINFKLANITRHHKAKALQDARVLKVRKIIRLIGVLKFMRVVSCQVRVQNMSFGKKHDFDVHLNKNGVPKNDCYHRKTRHLGRNPESLVSYCFVDRS